MTDKVIGEVLVALSATAGEGANWIKIAPRGRVDTRTGRAFEFHPEGLAAKFKEQDVRLPIDFDHGIARLASQGHRVDAVGWVEEMEARPDGLYGRVDWLEPGRAALSARTHRYVSPTFFHDKENRATGMHSIALVTAPDLANMPALADASGEAVPPKANLAAVAQALSLPEGASEADVLGKITQLQAGSTGGQAVPALLSALAEVTAKHRSEKVTRKVEAALAAGSLPPAARDWALKACAADEAAFDELMAKLGQPYAHLMKPNETIASMSASLMKGPENQEALKVASLLGIDPSKLTGGKS